MKNFKLILNNLIADESGQDLIEYALVAAVISLGAVAALGTVATDISGAFTALGGNITSHT